MYIISQIFQMVLLFFCEFFYFNLCFICEKLHNRLVFKAVFSVLKLFIELNISIFSLFSFSAEDD